MKLHNVPTCVAFLLFCLSANAQDPALSQFFANRTYLNPAFTGLESGLQLTTSARNQWLAADKGYNFFAATAEWQEPCWRSGFGLTLTHAQEGLAPLVSSSAGFLYSYVVPTTRGNWHVGLKYTYNQRRLDWSSLTFSDQLDPVFGNIYGSAVAAGAEKVTFHDFSFGLVRRWDSKIKSRGSKMYSLRSHVGLAINHAASLFGQGPDESFLQTGVEVPARITFHAGTIIPLQFLQGVGRKITLSPNMRFESHGADPLNFSKSLTLFSGGVYVIFLNQFTLGGLYNSRAPFAGAKHTNYFTFSAGFSSQPQGAQKDVFYLGLSVDVNASGLGIRSNNVYELNLRYAFRGFKSFCDRGLGNGAGRGGGRGKKSNRSKVLDCPHFAY
ncbi:MAG: PorP/SprF family type IX secretion system membrane protein [Saprospiraceae bacterium]|nr:PorP/SprF family type IX secretion system membrane protein [Saprospiraceae bacterium]